MQAEDSRQAREDNFMGWSPECLINVLQRSSTRPDPDTVRRFPETDACCARPAEARPFQILGSCENRCVPDPPECLLPVRRYRRPNPCVCPCFRRCHLLRAVPGWTDRKRRSEEHTSELQSLMRISYAVFCLKKKN